MAESDLEWRRGVTEAIWGHNGNKGLIVDVNTLCGRMETFIATVETRETERKSAAERSERKVNWLIAVLTLAAIAIGSLAAVLALGHPNRVQSVLEKLSTSQYQYTLAERTTK